MNRTAMGKSRVDRCESLARAIRDMSIPELNLVTEFCLELGIAVSFNQYLPELENASSACQTIHPDNLDPEDGLPSPK